ncbi:MAG TPA: hypothetical protein VGS41_05920 [Chthonomonadales bacterium]|nr:hypothetical protein [Chthonomonadales bacterium]
MQEVYEFRVQEEFAGRLFRPDEGRLLSASGPRLVRLVAEDPRLPLVGELDRSIRLETDRYFFSGWDIIRKYSRAELEAAVLFSVSLNRVFEPAGEECGTVYDESTACPVCGSGAKQVSGLRLDLRKAPKAKHIAVTIANETIVSQHLAERLLEDGLTGFELTPVRHKARYEDDAVDLTQIPTGREIIRMAELAGAPHPTGKFSVWLNRAENKPLWEQAVAENAARLSSKARRSGAPVPKWYQFNVVSSTAEVVAPTVVGNKPFDEDPTGENRCPLGDLIGLNLLSEVSISGASRGDCDVISTRQYVGVRRGLLRPRHVILISPRFREFLEREAIKGVDIEVAHLV